MTILGIIIYVVFFIIVTTYADAVIQDRKEKEERLKRK